jgi:hypothetical protein
MKQFSRFLATAIVMIAFGASSYAQVTATSTAAATIVAPILITNGTVMNFGNVANGATAGTVVLDLANGRTTTGGVTLPPITGTVTSAVFTITGQPLWAYTLTLPAGVTTIDDGLLHTMTVDTWSSNIAAGAQTIPGGGSQTLTIGATLHVGASQTPGAYISATPFSVTVQYN